MQDPRFDCQYSKKKKKLGDGKYSKGHQVKALQNKHSLNSLERKHDEEWRLEMLKFQIEDQHLDGICGNKVVSRHA